MDLVLEQTINADAACQRAGLSALINSVSARQRWEEPHFLWTTIISKVFEDLGMTKNEDVSNSLRPRLIRNDHEDMNKL